MYPATMKISKWWLASFVLSGTTIGLGLGALAGNIHAISGWPTIALGVLRIVVDTLILRLKRLV